MNKEIFRKNTP